MTLLLNMEGLKMSKEDAYQTKVMLEAIRTELKNALAYVDIIHKKYDHIECPQLGFSDEDYNEMQGADDNRP